MPTLGVFFSCEEHPASTILAAAQRAEEAGFRTAWISDHFHPWNDAQGQSPFVWLSGASRVAGLAQVKWQGQLRSSPCRLRIPQRKPHANEMRIGVPSAGVVVGSCWR